MKGGKGAKKKFVDSYPESHYDYIQKGVQIWYANLEGEGDPTKEPYNLGIVEEKDVPKRIVTMDSGAKVEFHQTLPIVNEKTIDVNDMANIKDINEVDLLYNLWNRLKLKKTFTNVGPTLLIVNPFTRIEGVYNDKVLDHFIQKQENEPPETRQGIDEPHLYDLVLIAIKEILKKESKNQALVISGESGAGKTEAAKNSMECITHYFSKLVGSGSQEKEDTPLERKILNCNPILEAFGNAKTVRNDNSSRFGKYVKIKLDAATNVIKGAEITAYLLEKSRISELITKERNYHVFYFLLACGDEKLLSDLHLNKDATKYKYLYTGKEQIMTVPTINDKECFDELKQCFESTGFTDEEIVTIFKVVACVLLLGNVSMENNNDKLVIEPQITFQHACQLIGVDSAKLSTVLTRKPPMFGSKEYGGLYTSELIKGYKDALAKELYNRLFFWIITKLNNKLDTTEPEGGSKYIGLLDIFGFECFDKNSLEQLCINYTNEQLQQLYIKDIFEGDKAEFRKEGLESKLHLLDATYKDNKDIIRLIKVFFDRSKDVKTDPQIFDLVDSFQKEIEKKTDKAFAKVKENKFVTNKLKKQMFMVEHTAKNVEYSVDNFVEKNKDETKAGVVDCLLESKNLLITLIFTNTTSEKEKNEEVEKIMADREKPDVNKIKMKYLGTKFKMQMSNLKKELKACDHHYIRCLKPNEEKKALLFHPNFVFNQIQYLGILATIQVRKSGFPIRRYYKDFFENFKLVINVPKVENPDLNYFIEQTKAIIKELVQGKEIENIDDLCLYGKNKIYMKQNFSNLLEQAKIERLKVKSEASKIIRVGTIFLSKQKRINSIKVEIENLQNFFRSNRSKILLQKKKEHIKEIQALVHTKNKKDEFSQLKKDFTTIQNSIRILLAKKVVEKKQTLMQMLSYRLQIKIFNMKKEIRIQMRKVAYKILIQEIVRDRIVEYEKSNLWNRIQPVVLSFLVRRKFKDITESAKKEAQRVQTVNALSNFQAKLFLKKIRFMRLKIKVIYNYATKEMFHKYYGKLIDNVLIIQKYLKVYLDKKAVFDKVSKLYLDDTSGNEISEMAESFNKILFPNKLQKPKKEDSDEEIQTPNTSVIETGLNCTTMGLRTAYSRNKTNFSPSKQQNTSYMSTYKKSRSNTVTSKKKKEPAPVIIDEIPDLTSALPTLTSYNQRGKATIQYRIYLFAKICDFDILSTHFNNEIYEKNWCDEYDTINKMNLYNKSPIQMIYTSNTHTVLLNNRGHMFSFGWNDKGQCGEDPKKTYLNFVAPDPSSLKASQIPIVNYSYAGLNIPARDMGRVTKVVVGDGYTLTMNSEGNCFGFGDNSLGQLGNGELDKSFDDDGNDISRSDKHIPKQITLGNLINDGEIKNICSTGNMNLVQTNNNELYIWYLSNQIEIIKPRRVYLDKKIKISQISCGKNFMIILTKNGIVYGSGSNSRGELGLDNGEHTRITPEEIKDITNLNEKIVTVRCGFKHSICLSQNGNCYTWGNNSYGQLGHVSKEDTRLYQLPEELGRIVQVTAGFRSTVVMNEKREVYYYGILSEDNQNTKGNICRYEFKWKNLEISNASDFTPVRLMSSWNNSFSIFYVTFADIRDLLSKAKNKSKIDDITLTLSCNWHDDNLEAPYIPTIARYFGPSNMIKPIN